VSPVVTPYEAAVELCKAVDTYRAVQAAGLPITETDIGRLENARRAWDGIPPRRRRGPDVPVSVVPEQDLSIEGACGASLSAQCFNGAAGCRVHP
jgi:hypothetical protein